MTDFSALPSPKSKALRIAFYVVGAGVLLWLQLSRLVRGDNGSASLFALAGGALVVVLIVSAVVIVIGRMIESNADRNGARVVASWTEAPGLVRYFAARRYQHPGAPALLPRAGAFYANDTGIHLTRYSTQKGLSWTWSQVHRVFLGRVQTTAGFITDGLIVVVATEKDVDTVPVVVSPSIYSFRSSRRARERLVAELQTLHREVIDRDRDRDRDRT